MIFPAVFAVSIGFGMIGNWTVLYLSKQIPELENDLIRVKECKWKP
jgi:hypothetical protein